MQVKSLTSTGKCSQTPKGAFYKIFLLHNSFQSECVKKLVAEGNLNISLYRRKVFHSIFDYFIFERKQTLRLRHINIEVKANKMFDKLESLHKNFWMIKTALIQEKLPWYSTQRWSRHFQIFWKWLFEKKRWNLLFRVCSHT